MKSAGGRQARGREPSLGDFLRSRLGVTSALGLSGAIVLTVVWGWYQEHRVVVAELDRILRGTVEAPADRLRTTVDSYANELRFLAATPPMLGILRARRGGGFDAREESTEAIWKDRLQRIFAAFLEVRPNLQQVRYIGRADGGRELVRVDRQGSSIQVVPEGELQRKGSEPYFARALRLGPGRVGVSDITLNREHGRISQPDVPTLRLATPVRDGEGESFGFVIVNVDARKLFGRLAVAGEGELSVYMANERGDFLIHPNPKLAFAFERGPSWGWRDEMGVEPPSGSREGGVWDEARRRVWFGERVALGDSEDGRFVRFAAAASEERISRVVRKRVLSVLLQALLVGGVAVLLVFLYWLGVRHRLLVRSEQRRLAAIVDGSHDAIVGVDASGVITSWNRAARRLFGLEPAAALGQRLASMMQPLGAEGRSTESVLEEILGTAEAREFSYRGAEGSQCVLSVVMSPVRIPDQGRVEAAAMMRDVTEERSAREALEQFARFAAHDLRAPTRRLAQWIQMLRRKPSSTECLDAIEVEAKQMHDLVEDLRSLTDTHPSAHLRTQETDLGALIQEVVTRHRDAIDERGAVVQIDPHPTLRVARTLVSMLYSNLLDNALKYGGRGSRVTFRAEQRDGEWHFEVENTGSTIDPASLERVFEPFTRTRALAPGTGLGLTICRRIVQVHRGRIHAASDQSGTRFRFVLRPLAGSEQRRTLGSHDSEQRHEASI